MKWVLPRWRQENVAPKVVSFSAGGFALGESVAKDSQPPMVSATVVAGEISPQDIPKVKTIAAHGDEQMVENTDTTRSEKLAAASARASFVVPAGYRITGSIFCARPVEVRGEFAGRLRATGDVTICSGGTSSGEIQARRIIIFGDVRERIVARESVHLENGGSITAPLTAPTLSVAAGGTLATDSIVVGYESQGQ